MTTAWSLTLRAVPKALILWTAGKTSEALSARDSSRTGIGVSDGSTSAALAMSARGTLDGVQIEQSAHRP